MKERKEEKGNRDTAEGQRAKLCNMTRRRVIKVTGIGRWMRQEAEPAVGLEFAR